MDIIGAYILGAGIFLLIKSFWDDPGFALWMWWFWILTIGGGLLLINI